MKATASLDFYTCKYGFSLLVNFKRKNMKKQDLINMVAEMTGGTKTQADAIVNGIFDTIAAEMAKGGSVDVAGFGKFEGKTRPARSARNPRTGETVDVPAQRVPKFRAGKKLKDTVK